MHSATCFSLIMVALAGTSRVCGRRDMDGAVQGLSDAADLSDRTFKALDDKAARLRKLKVLPQADRNLCGVLQTRPVYWHSHHFLAAQTQGAEGFFRSDTMDT